MSTAQGPHPIAHPLHDRLSDTRLASRHRRGDLRARAALIERYIPLAKSLAARYRRAADIDDLVQVASLGLVKAVDRWDPDRGFAFSSFAVPTILGELRRYFRDMTWDVRPPRRLQELCRSIEEVSAELSPGWRGEPSVGDLARRLGRTRDEIGEALTAREGRRVRSLDMRAEEGEPDAARGPDPTGRDDVEFARVEMRATLERMLVGLDKRSREVLRLRFEDDLHQAEIGERVGLSQMHVSRIIRGSIAQLGEAA